MPEFIAVIIAGSPAFGTATVGVVYGAEVYRNRHEQIAKQDAIVKAQAAKVDAMLRGLR